MTKRLRAALLGAVFVGALGLTACDPSAQADTPSAAQDAITQAFGPLADQAMGVARCESGLDPNAVSRGGGNWGLFQINTVHRGSFEDGHRPAVVERARPLRQRAVRGLVVQPVRWMGSVGLPLGGVVHPAIDN